MRWRMTAEPMKPQPPVTNIVPVNLFIWIVFHLFNDIFYGQYHPSLRIIFTNHQTITKYSNLKFPIISHQAAQDLPRNPSLPLIGQAHHIVDRRPQANYRAFVVKGCKADRAINRVSPFACRQNNFHPPRSRCRTWPRFRPPVKRRWFRADEESRRPLFYGSRHIGLTQFGPSWPRQNAQSNGLVYIRSDGSCA